MTLIFASIFLTIGLGTMIWLCIRPKPQYLEYITNLIPYLSVDKDNLKYCDKLETQPIANFVTGADIVSSMKNKYRR